MEKSTHSSEYKLLRSELLASRVAADLSQRELAIRLKVSHSWVAKVESGERRIDLVEFCWYLAACDGDPLGSLNKLLKRFSRRGTARGGKGSRNK